MKVCRHCLHFRLHLPRNTEVGLCSKWVQTEDSNGKCGWFKSRPPEPILHNPWSRNGKSFAEWKALTKGVDCMTGYPLEYWKIKAIADKHGIPSKDIEKFKNNAVKQLDIGYELNLFSDGNNNKPRSGKSGLR
ncbi:hypothetical protein [Flagellimonas sp. 2504JD4-2]